jgi:DNA phosphorothioation-associated putative methyltransferase
MAIGKQVRHKIYIHTSAFTFLTKAQQKAISRAQTVAGLNSDTDYNVARFCQHGNTVSLLDYQDFFSAPFPVLVRSTLVNLDTGLLRSRSYKEVRNPPILHRKELLLPPNHPQIEEYRYLTECLEAAGLFDETSRIGTKHQWEQRLKDAGFGWLLTRGAKPYAELTKRYGSAKAVNRHRTALSRGKLSRPIQNLLKHSLLTEERSFFDYGCGRGDDVRFLNAQGVSAEGWDPYFCPETQFTAADIVNLGYVINVIEEPKERIAVLNQAFSLANKLLIVSGQLTNERNPQHRPYRDGVLTGTHTFQRYFTQEELGFFLKSSLKEDPIPLAPGIFLVFKDKLEEQEFLEKRARRSLRARTARTRLPQITDTERQAALYKEHESLLELLWKQCLELGRVPYQDEIPEMQGQLGSAFRTIKRAAAFVAQVKGAAILEVAKAARKDDLLVYLALNLFKGRPRYRSQPLRLQRDIKAFFTNHTNALSLARELLFSINEPDVINHACQDCAAGGIGVLEPGHSLTLHSLQIDQVGPVLRTYIGCAAQLYGDLDQADLIKIHIQSGKVSVMIYDDFQGLPLPRLMERIKIRLREQDIDFFDYGYEFEPPFLYKKSQFLPPDFSKREEQQRFDLDMEERCFFKLGTNEPTPTELKESLLEENLSISGFRLVPQSFELDNKCGKYLTFRDLIECGQTQKSTQITNLPQQRESYLALYELCKNVLDPVIDYFGMIKLTYGFCSHPLSRKITHRVEHRKDQHCAHELNTKGRPICGRLGAAVDFIVEDENMYEVAKWVTENTEFDRLYFYGTTRPLHVSYSKTLAGYIASMTKRKDGELQPFTGLLTIT